MTLSKQAMRSAGWATLSGYSGVFISFFGNFILARILSPTDFGVYAFALSLLTILFMFAGFGSQEAIVQCRDESIEELIPTAFWISALIGIVLALTGTLIGLVVWQKSNAILGQIIIVTSWLNFMNSLSSTYSAILARKLAFRPIAGFDMAGNAASFMIAIVAALLGAGPWALIIRPGLYSATQLIGLGHASQFRLTLSFNWRTARWVWDFGWRMMVSRITEVLFGNLDNLVVGTVLGAAMLGSYSLAYRLAFLGQQFTQGPIQGVMLSTFAAVQNSVSKLQYGFERVNYWLWRCAVLLGLGVLFLGKDSVLLVYGVKWEVAGTVFQAMFLFLAVIPLHESQKSFLIGAGHINEVLKARSIQLVFFILALIVAAVLKNLIAVVWAVNLSFLLSWFIMYSAISKQFEIRWGYLIRGPLSAGLITFIVGVLITRFIPQEVSLVIRLVAEGLVIVIIYVSFLMFIERTQIRSELLLIRKQFVKQTPPEINPVETIG